MYIREENFLKRLGCIISRETLELRFKCDGNSRNLITFVFACTCVVCNSIISVASSRDIDFKVFFQKSKDDLNTIKNCIVILHHAKSQKSEIKRTERINQIIFFLFVEYSISL